MIKPTVGRVVLYDPTKSDPGGVAPGGPLAAIISWVWSDRMVNLMVIGSDGITFARTSVVLVQEDDKMPLPNSGYCEWPRY